MAYKKENNQLYIDIEAVSTLALAKEGLLYPVKALMNEQEAKETDRTKMYKGRTFPFSFILAPKGKRNEVVLQSAQKGDTLDLICTKSNTKVGYIIVDSIFEIDPLERVKNIYATYDLSHPGITDTLERLGKYAISGEYEVSFDAIKEVKEKINRAIKRADSKHTTAMMFAAKPIHRAHERVIRQTLETTDLLVIFLLKPYMQDKFSYELREETLQNFIDNYLPKNRVIVVPFENTYLFAGNNEVILNGIVVKNFGCDRFVIGDNHAGLGLYYDKNNIKSIFDNLIGFDVDINIVREYVYCNACTTLVSKDTCPHGDHHHIHYNSEALVELLKNGMIPPAVLVRKEVSAKILSKLFPNRFQKLQSMYSSLLPNSGIIENHSEEEFYRDLLKLYQTTSLS